MDVYTVRKARHLGGSEGMPPPGKFLIFGALRFNLRGNFSEVHNSIILIINSYHCF